MNKRDANQGACTNACRWDYKLYEAQEDANGDVIPVTQLNESEKALLLISTIRTQPRLKRCWYNAMMKKCLLPKKMNTAPIL